MGAGPEWTHAHLPPSSQPFPSPPLHIVAIVPARPGGGGRWSFHQDARGLGVSWDFRGMCVFMKYVCMSWVRAPLLHGKRPSTTSPPPMTKYPIHTDIRDRHSLPFSLTCYFCRIPTAVPLLLRLSRPPLPPQTSLSISSAPVSTTPLLRWPNLQGVVPARPVPLSSSLLPARRYPQAPIGGGFIRQRIRPGPRPLHLLSS